MDATQAPRKATLACPGCGRLNRVDLARAGDRPRCGHCRQPLALDRPLPLTDASFDRVIADSAVPVLVDFYADWCGPCHMMAPAVDQVAAARAGRALVAKVDTEANPRLAQRFRIASLPTVAVFRGGAEVARRMGAMPRAQLEALLDQAPAA